MTALEILSFHQLNPSEPHEGWWECRCGEAFSPEHVLANLKAAGYAVVELRQPNVKGKWSIQAPNDMFIEDGDVVRVLPASSGGTLSFLRPSAARAFAGALLAAADAAEAADGA